MSFQNRASVTHYGGFITRGSCWIRRDKLHDTKNPLCNARTFSAIITHEVELVTCKACIKKLSSIKL